MVPEPDGPLPAGVVYVPIPFRKVVEVPERVGVNPCCDVVTLLVVILDNDRSASCGCTNDGAAVDPVLLPKKVWFDWVAKVSFTVSMPRVFAPIAGDVKSVPDVVITTFLINTVVSANMVVPDSPKPLPIIKEVDPAAAQSTFVVWQHCTHLTIAELFPCIIQIGVPPPDGRITTAPVDWLLNS